MLIYLKFERRAVIGQYVVTIPVHLTYNNSLCVYFFDSNERCYRLLCKTNHKIKIECKNVIIHVELDKYNF